MNAAIIARVSRQEQLENSSPESQLQRCRDYCKDRGYNIVAEKIEAISGAFILARSEFMDLLNLAADGKLSTIVVDIPDRLGRGDAIAKLELLAQLNGAIIEYATPGRDTTTIEGLALKATDTLVSGIERLNIRRRTMQGKRSYAKAGRVIQTRFRPYGYDFRNEYDSRGRKVSCALVIRDDEEPEIVRRIFEWCAVYGMTTHSIAKQLMKMGVKTMGDKEPDLIKKHPGLWRPGAVYSILTNRTYCGEWYYGKRKVERLDTPEGIKQKYLTCNADDAILIPVPAIVSRDIWEAAQTQLEENHKKFVKPSKYQYLLKGRIKCGICMGGYGGATHINDEGRVYTYYRCFKNSPEYVNHRCSGIPINGKLAEAAVWDTIQAAVMDEERILSIESNRREEAKRGRKIIEDAVAAIDLQVLKATGKLDKLLDMYLDEQIAEDVYQEKKRSIEKSIEGWKIERKDYEKRLGDYVVLSPEMEKELRNIRAEIEKNLNGDVPLSEKAKLLNLLRVECIWNSDTGELAISGLFGKKYCYPNARVDVHGFGGGIKACSAEG